MKKMFKINNKNKILSFFSILLILLIIFFLIIIFSSKNINANNSNQQNTNDISKVDNDTETTNNDNMIIKITENNENNESKNENLNSESENENTESTEQIENDANVANKTREFNNKVAFIGDSRTQAFLMYAGLSDVVDYTSIGLMVDTAITKQFITNDKGEKITLLEDLKNRNVDTVYIMLGVNELGWVYSSIFIKKYEELIDKIIELKPNCEIILQSIIPVTKTKSDSDKIYNNTRITEYNTLIKEMASRKNVKYIDLVPILTDENGNLPEKASPDGIHLNKEYCLKWLDCLKNN